jgi:segregation and condensation protein B
MENASIVVDMCPPTPPTDESSANEESREESLKHSSDEASLQQLNDAFSEMLSSEQGEVEGTGVSAASGAGGASSEDDGSASDSAPPPPSVADPVPKRIIEALLFVGHPENTSLRKDEIARAIHGIKPEEVDDLIAELCTEYGDRKTAYDIVYDAGGYRMVLRPEFEKIRARFYGPIREAKLSQAAVEVLALVAYNQPTTSDSISQLRGHPSGSILSQLVRRQLLRFEKPEKKPRTPVYRTTPRFLKLFGLTSLEELPKNQELEN